MDDTETPGLADQVCFDLYAASRAVTNAYRPSLDELGLTYPQYLVMIVLWERGTLTVRDLGEALHLDHGTLTPLLRRMEANGHLTRQRASADERFVEIALTPHGESLRDHGTRLHCHMKEAMVLGDAGLIELQQTLRRLTAGVIAAPLPR